jgi:hypothetical protein
MFARFRQTRNALQVSLVETRRHGERVEHKHIIGLGSVRLECWDRDRSNFWAGLDDRLTSIDIKVPDKVLLAIQARIPRP